MKLCKDCFYCQKYDADGIIRPADYWQCSQVLISNPVDGTKRFATCSIERTREVSFAECGKEGKMFVNRKEREREINADVFPKEVDSNDNWELSRG